MRYLCLVHLLENTIHRKTEKCAKLNRMAWRLAAMMANEMISFWLPSPTNTHSHSSQAHYITPNANWIDIGSWNRWQSNTYAESVPDFRSLCVCECVRFELLSTRRFDIWHTCSGIGNRIHFPIPESHQMISELVHRLSQPNNFVVASIRPRSSTIAVTPSIDETGAATMNEWNCRRRRRYGMRAMK